MTKAELKSTQCIPFGKTMGIADMLYVNFKKLALFSLLAFICSIVLCTAPSFADDPQAVTDAGSKCTGLFCGLATHGGKIFSGMREIIFAASGFGVIAIALGSLFGAVNWKWLTAIIIGLLVIAATAGFINYLVGNQVVTTDMITDTLKY